MRSWLPLGTRKHPPVFCAECGLEIEAGERECWYGNMRLHVECGCRAWRRDTEAALKALKSPEKQRT